MPDSWIDRYTAAWARHAEAGHPESGQDALIGLLAFMDANVEYEDVPSGTVFVGYDGIRDMATAARSMSSDMTFTIVSAVCDGTRFAFENEARGTNDGPMGSIHATGKPFVIRGVSIGIVSETGLVTSHRDYWDLGSFLSQVGLLPGAPA